MTEIRLAIITVFVVLFWGWVLAISLIVQGDWVPGVGAITALIPFTLSACIKAREDWNS